MQKRPVCVRQSVEFNVVGSFLVFLNLLSAHSICFGQGTGLQLQPPPPAQVTSGQSFAVNPLSGGAPFTGEMNVSCSDSNATINGLKCPATFAGDCSNIPSCTVAKAGLQFVFDSLGTQTLTIASPALANPMQFSTAVEPAGPSELVICPPGQTFPANQIPSCAPTTSSGPPFTVAAGQAARFTILAVQGDAKHTVDPNFNGSVQLGYNLACSGASGAPIVSMSGGVGSATLTFPSPGSETLTATELSNTESNAPWFAPAAALFNIVGTSGSSAPTPKYFAGASFVVPPAPSTGKKSQDTPVGSWKGTASGQAIAFCDLLPGGNDANHCQAGPGVQVTTQTAVQHTANFEFAVADDGSVTGDGSVTYNAVVSGTLPGGAISIGTGTRHFTFQGKVLAWQASGGSSRSSCSQLPPGSNGFVLERDKNYASGSIQLDFPCGGSGSITLTQTATPPGASASAGALTSATGTIAPDGSLFDVCVPALGVALSQQAISWDDSKQELTLPFLLFGPSGTSGAYTVFKLPKIEVKQPNSTYQLQISSANVEGDPIVASYGGNQSPLKLFAPFDDTPVELSTDASGKFYVFTTSSKPGLGEPTTWQSFSNTWTARKGGGS